MSTRKPRTSKTPRAAEPVAPPMPPPTEGEIAASREISEGLRDIVRILRQRNLDNAVLLAKQAAAGRGPLVGHFAELGRRFAGTLTEPAPKPKLRVVNGGL
jgi:hypothetical protein